MTEGGDWRLSHEWRMAEEVCWGLQIKKWNGRPKIPNIKGPHRRGSQSVREGNRLGPEERPQRAVGLLGKPGKGPDEEHPPATIQQKTKENNERLIICYDLISELEWCGWRSLTSKWLSLPPPISLCNCKQDLYTFFSRFFLLVEI